MELTEVVQKLQVQLHWWEFGVLSVHRIEIKRNF